MTDPDTGSERESTGGVSRRSTILGMLALPGLATVGATLSDNTILGSSNCNRPADVSDSIVSPSGDRKYDQERISMQDAGADPTGCDLIDDVVQAEAGDRTHLFFPEGRYRLGEFAGNFRNLVLEGKNATIVPEDRENLWRLLDIRGPGNVIDGFAFDYRQAEIPPEIRVQGPDGWAVRNCLFCGVQKTNLDRRGGFALLPAVTSESGTGVIDTVYMHEGSAPPSGGDTRGGIWFGPRSRGRLRINRVWMESWAENTIYGHNTPGEVIIENSFFRNTNVAGTRIGGNTVLRNNTYVKTGPVPKQTHPDRDGQLMRGVWITGGRSTYGSQGSILIENCDFFFTNGNSTGPAIAQPATIDGTVTIRNCRIRQDTDHAIRIGAPTTISVTDIQITGKTENYAVFADPNTTIEAFSGACETNGAVSNQAGIAGAVREQAVSPPDLSLPDGLPRPADADQVSGSPD